MKSAVAACCFLSLLACTTFAATIDVEGDRTISKVIKLLQDMMDKSKADGDSERELYAKYKCYGDTTSKEKTELIAEMTQNIGILESGIEALQSENGVLSAENAQLAADIAANEQAREQAKTLRDAAAEAFAIEETDLTAAIASLSQAVDVLAAIGSDAAAGSAAAGFLLHKTSSTQLGKLQSTVKQALVAANTFLSPAQKQKVESFMQTDVANPEIVGILKQMKETFESNLESAKTTEAKAIESHENFIATKTGEHTVMSDLYSDKQTKMGDNDSSLATKKAQLATAKETKAAAEEFLANLEEIMAAKKKDYDNRKMLRANEDAAIAEAISILNSDQAFAAFGKTAATSTGATSFVQLKAIRSHLAAGTTMHDIAESAVQALERCAKHSDKARRVLLLLQAGNPFDKVISEIEKMSTLIDEEEANDAKQLAWCNEETSTNEANLEAKTTQIQDINTAITDLITLIDDPETGLKKQIADTEEQLETNSQSQQTETAERKESLKVYTKTIADAKEAQALLANAVKVLKRYYSAMDKNVEAELAAAETPALVQKRKQEPPASWEGSYAGQSDAGSNVIQMLDFIIGETKKEEDAAHEAETASVAAYEEMMQTLKEEEATLLESLVTLKKTLADKELELESQREALEVATREKAAIEKYLASIKPGCDFIVTNHDLRSSNRAQEKAALETAMTALKATPAYKKAMSEA